MLNWLDKFSFVLLGIRSALKEDISCSFAKLLYGTHLQSPSDFLSNPQISAPNKNLAPNDFSYSLVEALADVGSAPVRSFLSFEPFS